MIIQARKLLKETFGYDSFRPLQEDIIQSVLEKRDSLVLMPTGGGKSICYQIPALLFGGITVVVSPLISLMKDQVDQLTDLGLPAAMLNSSLEPAVYHDTLRLIRDNRVRLLYVAPETLVKPEIVRLLSSIAVDCIAIDEAHCISEWGHDFRPEYRQLAALRARFPGAACLALTATATERVRGDIIASLRLKNPRSYVASFDRENLFFSVLPKRDTFSQVRDFLGRFPGQSGIIYCFSRSGVDTLAARLSQQGFSARPYHAGLDDATRRRNQELFIRDEVQIIVATIAFGMGIHKSNIRFVIHHDLPRSIESYYQETGRAGRDGLEAHCLLLYGYGDTGKVRYFIDQKEDETERTVALRHLNAMVEYAETGTCRRLPLIRYFGEDYTRERCGMCDNCVNPPAAAVDVTAHVQLMLSCVRQVRGQFGISHIIDILRGSESQKIMNFGHQDLPAYGQGKQFSKKQWQHLARQFIRSGILIQDSDDFNTIKIPQRGHDPAHGQSTITGTILEETKEPRRDRARAAAGERDHGLFDLLRRKRKELADAANVPAYIIFSDRSLVEMAEHLPADKASMLDIYGVGARKFEKYGDEFIGIIRDYRSSVKN